MSFPEMAEGFELYDYQKDAVQRIINEKNTLLAFDVGSGKTYIMIAAAMTMRRMGLSRKNMFVIPNNIVGQWEKIFTNLYPKAKLLTIEPRSFKPELREKIVIQMRDGDYDGIIIAYSCFEMIPLSVNSFFLLCSGDIQYAVEAGDITERRMQRLIRFLNSFDKTANKFKERYDKLFMCQSELQKTQKDHNPYLEQIHVCENEVEKIRVELKIDGESRIIGQ